MGMKTPAYQFLDQLKRPTILSSQDLPCRIAFTKPSINSTLPGGFISLQETVFCLKHGLFPLSMLPPIRLYEKMGQLYSTDNRGLWIMKQLGTYYIQNGGEEARARMEFLMELKNLGKAKLTNPSDISIAGGCQKCTSIDDLTELDRHMALDHGGGEGLPKALTCPVHGSLSPPRVKSFIMKEYVELWAGCGCASVTSHEGRSPFFLSFREWLLCHADIAGLMTGYGVTSVA